MSRRFAEEEYDRRAIGGLKEVLDDLEAALGRPEQRRALYIVTRAEFETIGLAFAGPVVGLTGPEAISRGQADNTPTIAARLASIWWGGMVSIRGYQASEVTEGLCIGTGLATSQRRAPLATKGARAKVERAAGAGREGETARVALRVEALLGRSDGQERAQRLLRRYAGYEVDAGWLLEELGVEEGG